MTLTEFEKLLEGAGYPVFHYEARKAKAPYLVWAEYRKNNRHTDNRPQGGFWRVQVDYFTPKEFDAAADDLENLFADSGIVYNRKVWYESDIKLMRHLFDCEVVFDG